MSRVINKTPTMYTMLASGTSASTASSPFAVRFLPVAWSPHPPISISAVIVTLIFSAF